MKTLDLNNESIFCENEDRTLLIKIVLLDNNIQRGIHHIEDIKYQRTYTLRHVFQRRMKFTFLWDVTPCSMVQNLGRFERSYCLHFQGNSSSLKEAHVLPRIIRLIVA